MLLEHLRLLLVEDSRAVAQLVRGWLEAARAPAIEVSHAWTLTEAREWVAWGRPDALLLDLSLPDSDGLDTVRHMVDAAPGAPIVVLTGTADPELAIGALRAGAQDYLFKGHMDAESLVRTVVFAVERHRRQRAAIEAVDAAGASVVLPGLALALSPAPGRGEPLPPLRVRSPESFEALAERYISMMDAAMGASALACRERTRNLRAIAESLGALRAGSRDALDLHATALRARARLSHAPVPVSPDAAAAHAQPLLLQLLGHLADYFRHQALRADAGHPVTGRHAAVARLEG